MVNTLQQQQQLMKQRLFCQASISVILFVMLTALATLTPTTHCVQDWRKMSPKNALIAAAYNPAVAKDMALTGLRKSGYSAKNLPTAISKSPYTQGVMACILDLQGKFLTGQLFKLRELPKNCCKLYQSLGGIFIEQIRAYVARMCPSAGRVAQLNIPKPTRTRNLAYDSLDNDDYFYQTLSDNNNNKIRVAIRVTTNDDVDDDVDDDSDIVFGKDYDN